jgi:alanine or glycine:cation symporter, AGCS family
MQRIMVELLHQIRALLWGWPLLTLILGTGIYLTVRLRGIQFRYLGTALKLVFSRRDSHEPGDISHFQALMTALAATIGIGNIAGVATAMVIGGVGALFWMVVAALIGMATLYGEAFLSITFRVQDSRGEMTGGPMLTISRGLGWKWLAIFFAAAGAVAAITTGNMVQANSVTDVVLGVVQVPRWLVGVVISALIGGVLLGGIRSIGRVAGVLVPAMALLYLAGGVVILAFHVGELPAAVGQIFVAAFTPQAAAGGGFGFFMALQMGVARGLFASEAGLGSSSIAASAARTDMPGRQALISMTGAFLSVCVVCVVTGLVIAVTGMEGPSGVSLTVAAFGKAKWIVIVGAILFAYSTILGWAYYGERCCEFLFAERSVPLYRLIYVLAIIPGSIFGLDLVWTLADIANACMAIPNLISLLALSGLLARRSESFLQLLKLAA